MYGIGARGSQLRLIRLMTLVMLLLLLSLPVLAHSYTASIKGPQTVYAGDNLHFNLEISIPATVVYSLKSLVLSGSNVTFDAYCRAADCSKNALGEYRDWGGTGYPMIVRVAIPPTQPAGVYTLSVSTNYNGETATVSRPITVLAPPEAMIAPTALPSLPVPVLAKWESTMRTLSAKWCPTASSVLAFGVETQVWYYDGARVFFQIADYTKDKSYEACALSIARQYRDYVVSNDGKILGSRVFTGGLRMAYERTGDASFKNAAILLSTKNIWAQRAVGVSDGAIREVAYLVNAFIDAEKLGAPRHPFLLRYVDYLRGHYDQIFVSKTYSIHQTIYDGLAAEAMIAFYELTGDPRIPPTIKPMLDWMYDVGWDKAAGRLIWNPDPIGPTCASSCQVYMNGLINLIVPSFAWYWSITGDAVYQQRGDEIWRHALDEDISYSGKIFSQNYRWSFDYLRWRKGSSSACTYIVSPTTAVVSANGGQVLFGQDSPAGCSWTVSTAASWATITGMPAGPNPGTVAVTVSPNTTILERSAEVEIAGTLVTITQAAAPVVVNNLLITPSSTSGGVVILVKASLSRPAPAGGLPVRLEVSNQNVLPLPTVLTVPAGATSGSILSRLGWVSANTPVTVTATTASNSLTSSMMAIPTQMAGIIPSAATVKTGATATLSLHLSGPAPTEGITVALTSSAPTKIPVPASVFLPGGTRVLSVVVTAGAVTTSTPVTITGIGGAVTKAVTLTVAP